MSDKTNNIILISKSKEQIETSIATFNQPLADLLAHVGLPTENVLAPITERGKVIAAFETVLNILPVSERDKSFYLSKFLVSISVGLFDGALTFLWDETIKALRKMVATFDLEYFFNVAESINNRYKSLKQEEDLLAVSDHDLLEISRRIGLINDVNFKRLEHVNYLRNHASASHPNDNEVTGLEILSLLENCLRYAIVAKPDHSVIKIKQLFHNIRTQLIPHEDFSVIGQDFAKQPQERIDDFLIAIVGMYCDPQKTNITQLNIEKLTPEIWRCSTEETKYIVGSKFGLYRKNGDVSRKDSIQKILEIVNGQNYKDEDSIGAELIEKLQNLRSAHYEWNNFYYEYPHVRAIDLTIPKTGKIPNAARRMFVKIISICFVGNGKGFREGVDENAVEYYKKYINNFDDQDIYDFLDLFTDPEFVNDLNMPKAEKRMKNLATFLKGKTKDLHRNKLLDIIANMPTSTLYNVSSVKQFKDNFKFMKR